MNARRILKALLALLMLGAVTAGFFCPPYGAHALLGKVLDPAVRLQPAATWIFLAVLALTPLVGRLFCETCCPLGILQSLVNRLFHPRAAVRRVCTRLPETRAQVIVRCAVLVAALVLLASGFGALAWFVTPYAIYGKALALFVPGVALFAAILALAALGKGRVWCNWICPVGTLFTLLSQKSLCQHKVGPGCSHCRACFGAKSAPAEKPRPAADDGVTRREALQGVAVLAAAETLEKTVDGGYAPVSLPGVPNRAVPVLPPGAADRTVFNQLCVACGRCIKACRGGCLVPATSLARLGQPEMDFRRGHCLTGCAYACGAACPTGAIRRISPQTPHADVHVGYAVWTKDLCLRAQDGVPCTACSRKCPVGAIHLVEGFPVVDRAACIGCGACEHVCPARPAPAIHVEGVDRPRVVTPMTKAEVASARDACLAEGRTEDARLVARTLERMEG